MRAPATAASLAAVNEPMGPTDAASILTAVAHLAARLDRIETLLVKSSLRPRESPRRLLSMRAAASALGVDRGTTLKKLIEEGALRTVIVAGKSKVPASEVERLEREGPQAKRHNALVPKPRLPRRPAAEPPLARDEVRRIAALQV